MRIAITGASGFIGSALVPHLTQQGHEVIRLERGRHWAADRGLLDPDALGTLDAVIHLAGENVAARRWSHEFKARLRDSRVGPTQALTRSLAALPVKPRVFIGASAIGFYGDRGATPVDETSAPGDGFLADLCQAWEAAARPALDAGIRVVHPRFGLILDKRGGALAKMALPFRLGIGGRLGPGTQYVSWVALADVLAIVGFLLTHDVHGPVNVTAPTPVPNATFVRALGRAVHRPTILPVPGFVLTTLFGEMAEAELLGSKRVLPRVLNDAGYVFRYPDIDGAMRAALAG